MLPELSQEEYSAALDGVVAEILSDVGITGPPVDAVAVARALGITVAWDRHQRGRGRYVRLHGYGRGTAQPTIVARPDIRPERDQWTVAHEIGEHVAHRVFARLGVDPREAPPNGREQVANHWGSRLLLPAEWFAADAPAMDWDLIELKARYRTASHELIARRMLDLPATVIITIFDNDSLTFRSSNVPGQTPPPARLERDCRQTTHDREAPCTLDEGPFRVQGWPVHEEGWKREILRTEVNTDWLE